MSSLLRAFVATHVLAYRLSGGLVGGSWGKARILLLTTTGRKTAELHTAPLLYLEDSGRLVVVATNNGAEQHPGWYHNLRAESNATVQVARDGFAVTASVATAEERARLWPMLVRMYPNYERDQRRTSREIPVVILDPVPLKSGGR